nr:plastocyanin/azurin family copper-binding protein [uncultured Mucilaginibacter sp.]
MKKIYLYLFAASFVLASCGGGSKPGETADTTAQQTEVDPAKIPGIDKVALSDTISLQANDEMHFNKDLFKIKSGKKAVLILKNVGSATNMPMSHNVVILGKGTDMATFGEEARKFKANDYIPATMVANIVAHTPKVMAGKTAQVEFTAPAPGVYDFICSFEGHWGSMQGQIVVE